MSISISEGSGVASRTVRRPTSPCAFTARWTAGTAVPLATLAATRSGLAPGWPTDGLLADRMLISMAIPAFAIGAVFLVNCGFLQGLGPRRRLTDLWWPVLAAPLCLAVMLAVISAVGTLVGFMTVMTTSGILRPWMTASAQALGPLVFGGSLLLTYGICGWLSGFALSLAHLIASFRNADAFTTVADSAPHAAAAPASLTSAHRRGGAAAALILLAAYFGGTTAAIGLRPGMLMIAALPLAALPHALAAARVIAGQPGALARVAPTGVFLARLALIVALIVAAATLEGWLGSAPFG